MARTAVTPVAISSAGAALGFVEAPDLELSLINSLGDTALVVQNGSLAPITVTVKIPKTVDGQAVASKVVTVAAGATKVIGPFLRTVYNQADGTVHADVSVTADVDVAALKWVQL